MSGKRIGVGQDQAMDEAMDDLQSRMAALSPAQRVALAQQLSGMIEHDRQKETGNALPSIEPMPREGDLPLSASQERVWFLQQLNPESLAYVFPTSIRLDGVLDVAALERSLVEFVARHEIFRTTFHSREGCGVQTVHPAEPFALRVEAIDSLPEALRDEAAAKVVAEEVARPFDITELPLIRWTLLRLAADEHVLVHIEHHLLHDGWSYNLFVRELIALYRAFAAGLPSPLPEPRLQFGDFALWQRAWLADGGERNQLAYWKAQLAGCSPVLDLPLDRPRPANQTFGGAAPRSQLPIELCKGLRALSRRSGTTLFMTMLAGFSSLMSRYSGQEDLCIGSGIANRTSRETEDLPGMIVNNVVLRVKLQGNPNAAELLTRVRETTLEAYENQDVPFDRVVEAISPPRDPSYNPLFQVMFAFHDSPLDPQTLTGLTVSPSLQLSNGSAKFDLNVIVVPHSEMRVGARSGEDEGLMMIWEYNSDLFDASTIEGLSRHYRELLQGIVTNPDRPIATLPLLNEAEKRRQLEKWAVSPSGYPADQAIHRLFEAQVARDPDAMAISFGETSIRYGELNARANRLARHLRKRGVGAESVVGICLDRSPEMIISALAVLKTGGAYAPIDPEYPAQRIAGMLAGVSVAAVVTQSQRQAGLPPYDGPLISLDGDADAIADEAEENLSGLVSSDQLAMVMHTSGSTGEPKGIGVPHRAVARLVRNTNYLDLGPSDRVAQVSNFSFDAATFEIFGALLNGAELVGIEKEVLLSPRDFAAALKQREIAVLFLTTALFNQVSREVPEAFASLRRLLFGGEAVDPRCVEAVLSAGPPEHLLHVYGPTENTTFSTWHCVEEVPKGATAIPIGGPISNSEIYVLDRHLEPTPQGGVGELYVGGAGLARGYLGRPAATAQAFVPHPFSSQPGARLYRTGDLVRQRPGGELVFVGRADHQVKLRGFRIELGEIEAALVAHHSVGSAAVLVREDRPGDRRLVGYVSPRVFEAPAPAAERASLDISELRRVLGQRLPSYMIPAAFVVMDALPLTPNGKLDRDALPVPDEDRRDQSSRYVAPESQDERALAAIWSEVLGMRRIGIHDNFFELGGQSLQLTQVVSRARASLGVDLSLRSLFEQPTISGLADCIDRVRAGGGVSGAAIITPLSREGRRSRPGES